MRKRGVINSDLGKKMNSSIEKKQFKKEKFRFIIDI